MKRRCALGALAALALPAILPRVTSAKPAALPWPASRPTRLKLDSRRRRHGVVSCLLRGRPLLMGISGPAGGALSRRDAVA